MVKNSLSIFPFTIKHELRITPVLPWYMVPYPVKDFQGWGAPYSLSRLHPISFLKWTGDGRFLDSVLFPPTPLVLLLRIFTPYQL